MSSGPDTEHLFRQLRLKEFPYRNFHNTDEFIDLGSASGSERWLKSLDILQREWERAAADQVAADAQTAGPEAPSIPSQASVGEAQRPAYRSAAMYDRVFPDPMRPRLQRLFQRTAAPSTAGTPLSELFNRIS